MKKLSKLTIITLIAFIYFEPQMFKNGTYQIFVIIDYVYKLLKIGGFLYVFLIYLDLKKTSKLFLSMTSFQIAAFISTILNRGDVMRFIGPALTPLTMIMIAEILINDNNLYTFIKRCLVYFRFCFILNIISIIIVDFVLKNDLNVYFLGIDNRFIFTYLPWITFEFLYSIYKYNKISKTSFMLFLLSEATLLYKFSLSAMIVSFLWFFLIISKNKIVKHSKAIFLLTLYANYLIVVLRIQDLFELLLSDLHKGTTISGRTYLWDSILKDIKNCPILGRGMQSIEYERYFFYINSKMAYFKTITPHAHNSYMTVLQRCGLLGLGIYIYILWICFYRLSKSFKNKYSKVLFISLLIILILSIFDTIDCSGFYFILACTYSINLLDKNENVKKEYVQ